MELCVPIATKWQFYCLSEQRWIQFFILCRKDLIQNQVKSMEITHRSRILTSAWLPKPFPTLQHSIY